MTARYFIDLSYNGTRFHGWQVQPNAPTIQETLEKALFKLTQKKLKTIGAGRTDTGVHASHFMTHFNTEQAQVIDLKELTLSLNAVLPSDIVVHRILPVHEDLHARFSAISRNYEYHIVKEKNPFRHEFVYCYNGYLDVAKMNNAARMLPRFKDFTSFSKLHSQTGTNFCKIMEAYWTEVENELVFTIRADRFLRDMVRAIVGTMLQIGSGKRTPEEIENILSAKDRGMAGPSAPARGLILNSIEYPEDSFNLHARSPR